MKLRGKKFIVFSSILEILMGIGSIAFILWILAQDAGSYSFYGVDATNLVKDSLWALILIYAASGFQILAGIVGLIGAGKPKMADVCRFFGLVLILIQVFNFSHGHGNLDVTSMIVNTLLLIAPVYYYYGAMLNKKELTETK